ncbi:MAG: alpha-galactosidase, partial [Alistipes sp.]|nr:alpha-galactosidase [Alistipes sp.]
HRAEDQSGIVVAFRRAVNTQESIEVKLRAIDESKSYTLRNFFEGSTSTMSGAELKQALRIELKTPRSAVLLEYAPAE